MNRVMYFKQKKAYEVGWGLEFKRVLVRSRSPGETREARKGVPVLRKTRKYFFLPPSQTGNAIVGLAGTAGATQILYSFSDGPRGNT